MDSEKHLKDNSLFKSRRSSAALYEDLREGFKLLKQPYKNIEIQPMDDDAPLENTALTLSDLEEKNAPTITETLNQTPVESAMKLFIKLAQEISEEDAEKMPNCKAIRSKAYFGLGMGYLHMHNYKKALFHYKYAWQHHYSTSQAVRDRYVCLFDMLACNVAMREYAAGIECFTELAEMQERSESVKKSDRHNGANDIKRETQETAAWRFFYYGICSFHLGDYENAQEALKESNALFSAAHASKSHETNDELALNNNINWHANVLLLIILSVEMSNTNTADPASCESIQDMLEKLKDPMICATAEKAALLYIGEKKATQLSKNHPQLRPILEVLFKKSLASKNTFSP